MRVYARGCMYTFGVYVTVHEYVLGFCRDMLVFICGVLHVCTRTCMYVPTLGRYLCLVWVRVCVRAGLKYAFIRF